MNEMDKLRERILKFIIANDGIDVYQIQKHFKKYDLKYIEKIIKEFIKNDFVKEGPKTYLITDTPIIGFRHSFYVSTHEADVYFEMKRKQFFNMIFSSVVLPLIVAVLTTLLTNFLLKPNYDDVCNYCTSNNQKSNFYNSNK